MNRAKFLPLLLCGLAACRNTPPVYFSSSPPGAILVVDGQETGFVTPCAVDLEDVDSRTVEFRLNGFEPAVRVLRYQERADLVYWTEASGDLKTWNFPLWLGSRDFFLPKKNLSGESPSRIYVRLRRLADL